MIHSSKTLFISTFLLLFGLNGYAQPKYPQLHFQYSSGLDQKCYRQAGQKKDPEAAKIAKSGLLILQSEWNRTGEKLLAEAARIVGRDFKRREYTVSIVTCPIPFTMDEPLIVNIRAQLAWARRTGWGLKKTKNTKNEEDLTFFPQIVFHELLHTYVREGIQNGPTEILRKYKAESKATREHLHVYALVDQVYRQLDIGRKLVEVRAWEEKRSDGLARAWQIVGVERAKKIISELAQSH